METLGRYRPTVARIAPFTHHRQGSPCRALVTTLWVGAALALLATACGGSEKEATPPPTSRVKVPEGGVVAPGTFAVGLAHRDFNDPSRPTRAHGGAPELRGRKLPTMVLYPAEGRAASAPLEGATPATGRWPLIVFSHGSTRSGADYLATLAVWASAGYVVAAPDYPLSKTGVEGGTDYTDAPEQARDVAFLIEWLQALSKGGTDKVLGKRLVPGAIGIAGQSFGAITSLLAGFHTCCAIREVEAVVSFAGAGVPGVADGSLATDAAARPLLSVHGDADPTLPYAGEHDGWAALHGDKFFLTLPGGGHDDGFFDGTKSAQGRVVSLVSLGFFDRFLKDDNGGLDRMQQAVVNAGPSVAKLETQ